MSHGLKLITTRQVAERIGIDVSTVARWVRDGKITPAFEADGLTGVRLFDPADVDAFIASRKSDGGRWTDQGEYLERES